MSSEADIDTKITPYPQDKLSVLSSASVLNPLSTPTIVNFSKNQSKLCLDFSCGSCYWVVETDLNKNNIMNAILSFLLPSLPISYISFIQCLILNIQRNISSKSKAQFVEYLSFVDCSSLLSIKSWDSQKILKKLFKRFLCWKMFNSIISLLLIYSNKFWPWKISNTSQSFLWKKWWICCTTQRSVATSETSWLRPLIQKSSRPVETI